MFTVLSITVRLTSAYLHILRTHCNTSTVQTSTNKPAHVQICVCIHTPVCTLGSRIFLVIMSTTDEAATRDHRQADSSKLGPNLEGIQSTVITRGEHRVRYNHLPVGVSRDWCSLQKRLVAEVRGICFKVKSPNI